MNKVHFYLGLNLLTVKCGTIVIASQLLRFQFLLLFVLAQHNHPIARSWYRLEPENRHLLLGSHLDLVS